MAILQGGSVIPGMMPSASNMIAGEGPLKCARALYDFSVDGGAVGTINLQLADKLPVGAVVLFGFVDVLTPPTSGGAGTLAITLQGTGDIVAAAAVSGAPWSSAGKKSIVPVATGATAVTVSSSAKQIAATVATAALTAGKVEVYLFYVETV